MIARPAASASFSRCRPASLANDGQHVLPDFFGIVLDPARLRIDLPMLARRLVDDRARRVEQHRLGRRRALIDGQDMCHVEIAPASNVRRSTSACFNELGRRRGEAFHRDAVVAEDVGLAAGDRVFVRDADDPQRHGDAGLHQHGGTRFAQSAVDRMFFDGDDRPGTRGRRRASRRVSSGLTVCMLSTRQLKPVFGKLARRPAGSGSPFRRWR